MAVAAYCFMPDHLHTVIEGQTHDADLVLFVKLAKQTSSFDFKRRSGRVLWQPSWHDRVIRPSDELNEYIRYVVENPVRAGLVTDPADYPFTGSETMSREALMRHSRHYRQRNIAGVAIGGPKGPHYNDR